MQSSAVEARTLAGLELVQCVVALVIFCAIAMYGGELAWPVMLAWVPLALAACLHVSQQRIRRALRAREDDDHL